MKRISLSPDFLLLLCAFAVLAGPLPVAAVLGAAALHEGAHWAALAAFGAGVQRLSFDLFGGRMVPRRPLRLNARREAVVCAAGPAANLCAAALLAALCGRLSFGCFAAGVQLACGLFNLLPASGLDGARILLCLCGRSARAARAVRALTFLVGTAGVGAGTALLCGRWHNPTVLLFGVWAIARAALGADCCEAEECRV